MPSIINSNLTSTSSPSTLDFVAGDSIYYSNNASRDSSKPTRTPQDLKDSARRRWSDPEDEFSVPIHTEHPLITKKPLDMSSFLLNYRAMHRSVEIMIPPPSVSQIGNEASSTPSTSSIYPTIPDGPIYIHHRSTISGSPLSSIVSCSHIHCFEHNHQPFSIARSAPTACQKKQPFSDYQDNEVDSRLGGHSQHHGLTSKGSRRPSLSIGNNKSSSQEPSFLDSHIASIGQWLSSNTRSA